MATGLKFADVIAAKEDSGILLVGVKVPSEVRSYLKERNIISLIVGGGDLQLYPLMLRPI